MLPCRNIYHQIDMFVPALDASRHVGRPLSLNWLRRPIHQSSAGPVRRPITWTAINLDLYQMSNPKKAYPKHMHPSFYRFLNRPFARNACGSSGSAHGLYWGMAGLSVVCSLCLLGTVSSLNAEPAHNAPSVRASVQAPPYTPDKLPYRLMWGANTVVVEVEHGTVSDDDPHQPHQVRIIDASGHLLCRLELDRVADVRLVKPLVAGEQGVLIAATGGNGGLEDYHGFGKGDFGKGISTRFHVSGAVQVDVKDLNGDGTAEIIAIYRLEDIDGGGEHHGPRVTVVYQWNGTKYVEATRSFPALTRASEKENQSTLAAIEAKVSQSSAAPGAADSEIDGHYNAAVGYLMNATFAGDGTEAQTWLKDNIRADRLQLRLDVKKSITEAAQSMSSPLAQDAGDDAQDAGDSSRASTPVPGQATPNASSPTKAAPNTAQNLQRAGVVPGQSLGILKIGESRADVIAAIKMRPTANYDLKQGLVEDDWSSGSSDGSGEHYSASVWYRQGKVVQAQTTITEKQRANFPSFNALIAGDRGLKEVCYSLSYRDAPGGVDFYCFDDVRKGIAYGIGVNGDAYMTGKPDTLIIHAPGVPYFPFQGQTNVTRVNGPGSILYQNQAEEDKAFARGKQLKSSRVKSSHVRSHKKY